ncbi:MAG: alanine racemase [Betaproteobacteria bacterium]|nr:alanine racemase [Betaproteobacteria bacterium]
MRPISATIDLAALRHNYGVARRLAPGAAALAVVKANAYGHGIARAARALADAGGFAVVELDAAVRLRETGFEQPIVLLEGFFEARELSVIREYRLSTVVHSFEQLEMMRGLPAGRAIDVMVKLDSGMNRLGFPPGDIKAALEQVKANPAVGAITLITHFANADDEKGVQWQLERFERATAGQAMARSLANSAAILRHPQTHADVVRPGIMLYGCSPFAGTTGADVDLKPVMTLASEIIAVRDLAPGEAVGYGGAYTAETAQPIGVVACGYADGYPRHAPTDTPVLVGDRLTRTLGRVSMDMLTVDLSGVPEARVGTRVVLWGEGNPVEHVATAAGTVGYELLCALAPRVRIIEKA